MTRIIRLLDSNKIAQRPPPENFEKRACEIFHDGAISFFSNPQLVWLVEQSVSSEVIFLA